MKVWCGACILVWSIWDKPLIITNMQIIITKIWFWSNQICKIRCNMLINTDVRKSICNTYWGDITQRQICTRLLSISMLLKLRTMRGCMAKCLAQLVTCILPPFALPITLSIVTVGGSMELVKIWFGAAGLFPLLLNWLGHHPPWQRPLFRPEFPED